MSMLTKLSSKTVAVITLIAALITIYLFGKNFYAVSDEETSSNPDNEANKGRVSGLRITSSNMRDVDFSNIIFDGDNSIHMSDAAGAKFYNSDTRRLKITCTNLSDPVDPTDLSKGYQDIEVHPGAHLEKELPNIETFDSCRANLDR